MIEEYFGRPVEQSGVGVVVKHVCNRDVPEKVPLPAPKKNWTSSKCVGKGEKMGKKYLIGETYCGKNVMKVMREVDTLEETLQELKD